MSAAGRTRQVRAIRVNDRCSLSREVSVELGRDLAGRVGRWRSRRTRSARGAGSRDGSRWSMAISASSINGGGEPVRRILAALLAGRFASAPETGSRYAGYRSAHPYRARPWRGLARPGLAPRQPGRAPRFSPGFLTAGGWRSIAYGAGPWMGRSSIICSWRTHH